MSALSAHPPGEPVQTSFLDPEAAQFRLVRIQTYDWGTFAGLFDIAVPREGYLFVGPSGSGKSTLLDAHAALLTPPKWVDFNVAAREAERNGRDRSVMTYLRGAWAQQSSDDGDYAVQYLRTGTTWSAIAETYSDDADRVVTLVQLLWVRGNSTQPGDAKRLYLVLERAFDLQALEHFPRNDFDIRRLKSELGDASIYQEFSAYQERFRRLLGIDRELSLRLLHKTQSAKNLGDLNTFLRDFMLDPPDTFGIADRLVAEFNELDAAHQAVVSARQQIEVLDPAQRDHQAMSKAELERTELRTLQQALDGYREHRRHGLLEARIAELDVALEAARQESEQRAAAATVEADKLADLHRQRAGIALGVIDQLQRELDAAERERPERLRKRDLAAGACAGLGWTIPDAAVGFIKRVSDARARLHDADRDATESQQQRDTLVAQLRDAEKDFGAARIEVAALERQASNLPAELLALRATMAEALGIPESRLPFAGELIEVRPEASAWRGAAERVLGGFARSLLVDDRHYAAVSAYLNERHIGARLAYFRVMPQVESRRQLSSASLVRKLQFAQGPFHDWLREELKAHFDFECADTLQAFRNATRAVTREGQVKHSAARHEKNDRSRVDDPRHWVLGLDNRAKRELYRQQAAELGARVAQLQRQVDDAGAADRELQVQLRHCQTLANLRWNEIDIGGLLAQIDDLGKRLEAERRARPEIAELDARIDAQQQARDRADKRQVDARVSAQKLGDALGVLHERLQRLVQLHPDAVQAPPFAEQFDARVIAVGRELTLDSLDQVAATVDRGLSGELRDVELQIGDLKNAIAGRFAEFNRRWPAESGGLDPTVESADDYFAKLVRLRTDNLPKFEERFLTLLREQSDQNLALLSTRLDLERSAIRTRMELVNESLAGAAFGEGTTLKIDTTDRLVDEVRQFRAALKDALSRSIGAELADAASLAEAAERRFGLLAALVRRLQSQETADRHWRSLVLDVRQHVEFVARELDKDGIELEVYRSGAGKSGGQRQKLAATCLAAALRYQLGGRDRALPSYSTVVLDEAFDKADAEFTRMAMEIFRTFGFQMIVATPLKSVMTLEPFIGGACFVHIRDRRQSTVVTIDYDVAQKRLALPETERRAVQAADAESAGSSNTVLER